MDETGLSGAIGGRRLTTLSVPFLDLVGLDDVSVSVVASVGLLDYTSTVGANGDLRLAYVGDFTADLSGDAEIQIDFTGFDLGNVTPMAVTVTLGTGGNAANLTHLLTATGAQTTVFSFSEFTNINKIDLASVDALIFEFDPGDGGDFRIGGIGSVVPEPATLVLLLAGAGAVLRRRRGSR
ncbi:MAG: PEP-CTERM sorting domain-containing protein [Planctomycetes bacterium]|nr:PEP-CTERM sorting domain-containing protein [Planctomycetota bacterium]